MANKVILIGRTGKDIEVVTFANGGKIGKTSLATTKKYKDKDMNLKEDTQWHNLIFNGNSVDVVEKYLKKGSKVFIEGEIRYNQYEKQDGQKVYSTEIMVFNFEFLDSKPTESSGTQTNQTTEAQGYEDTLPF